MTKHLTIEERIKMEALIGANISADKIATQLRRHRSTIYREISRSGVNLPSYSAYEYQKQARLNMSRNQDDKKPSKETIKIIEAKILNEQWSPEQISQWLSKERVASISHTWIYQYIKEDQVEGGELNNHLRRGISSYRKGHKPYNGKIKNRVSIERRPDIINNRARCGDYEVDLIVGPKNHGAILTMIDRKSRECRIAKLDGKSAISVTKAVIKIVPTNVLSITSDNGNEFANHEQISLEKNLQYYFAHPYASYERGSIENLNGLIRQYIPKGTEFENVDEVTIKDIERKLNNRPRKVLDFLTPIEYTKKYEYESRLSV
jgi:IS30 family transposase